jgi:hypothetical protein
MRATKTQINTFNRGVEVFADLLKQTSDELSNDQKHISDRLEANLAEMREISESLHQTGLLDEELLECVDIGFLLPGSGDYSGVVN